MTFAVVAIILLIAFIVVYVAMGVRIVRPYQKGVVEQLGRYKETVDPGLRIIKPVLERLRTVDMREQVIDVPPQEVITEDNVAVSVDAVIYFEPTDPQRLLYNISNFILAVTKLAQTNLRNVIGEMSLDEAFTSRERVNAALRQILDDATDKWGVRVVRVEIQRTRAAADQYREETVALGEAEAIRSVYGAILNSGTDDRVIAIKYLEALQGIADGRATKIFVPADMSATLGTIGGIAEMLRDGDFPSASPTEPRTPRPSPSTTQPSSVTQAAATEATEMPPLPPRRGPTPPPPAR